MYVFDMDSSWVDYPDTRKLCVNVYFMGCVHACEGCHNPNLQNESYIPNRHTICEDLNGMVKAIILFSKRNRTNNVALMGGDPLFEENTHKTKYITNVLYDLGYNIIIYTGYSNIEFIKTLNLRFTYLKTGKYIKVLSQPFRLTDTTFTLSSTNQKIYDHNYILLSQNGTFKYN